MTETVEMEVSRAERAVLLAMRQEDTNGEAIFSYAMQFDDYSRVDGNAEPWTKTGL